jgi:hypothetical protein
VIHCAVIVSWPGPCATARDGRGRLARRNAKGFAGGAGITLWPPELRDLMCWVFGEDTYVRGAVGPAAAPAPGVDRPFHRGDGLLVSG